MVDTNNKCMLFDSEFKEQFKDIRCFDDSEVTKTLKDLHESTRLDFVFSQLFPGEIIDTSGLYRCRKISEIQAWLIKALVPKLAGTYSSLDVLGLENLDKQKNYVFVSNHRDIAMDPLLVNIALNECGYATAHNAIGDNLLLSVTGTRMALLNKCFRVARSVRSPKAMLLALKNQARYIRHIHTNFKDNVWIAQREGRALSGIDSTNPALIKMLVLGSDKSEQLATLNSLNICPVTISYEWDPCDFSKAQRLIKDETLTSDEKLANDKRDILMGLLGFKGRITVHFGSPLFLEEDPSRERDLADRFAEQIDAQIKANYAVYPINLVAARLVKNNFELSALTDEQESEATNELLKHLKINDISSELSQVHRNLVRAYAQPALCTSG